MAFADHHNAQLFDVDGKQIRPRLIAAFTEKTQQHRFEVAQRFGDDAIFPDFPHLVYVGPHNESRYARVLKTVAYIVVDEDEAGEPVVEKWAVHSGHQYN